RSCTYHCDADFSLTLSHSLFFFTATPTPELYTLSLHDALPISATGSPPTAPTPPASRAARSSSSRKSSASTATSRKWPTASPPRSEEHTSELQSLAYLVCRLLLEKKKKTTQSTQRYQILHLKTL